MTLNFPNSSRSYDPEGHRIRFWGHDQAMEVQFFVDERVLFKLYPQTIAAEAGILAAFDKARERIFEVARRMYSPRRGSFYVLAAEDF